VRDSSGNTQSGIPADILLLTDGGFSDVIAAGLSGVTAVGDSSEGRALGKGGNGAGRSWAPVRAVWCNQSKKDEGGSCAWTDAHSNKDSDNVAAPNILNLPLSERQAPFAVTGLIIRSNFA
jgi:hypothetical protein